MNETMARSLSPKELAEELRYSTDPGVSKLAMSIINHEVEFRDFEEELNDAEGRVTSAEEREADGAARAAELEDLLRECVDELDDGANDLRDRIKAVLI